MYNVAKPVYDAAANVFLNFDIIDKKLIDVLIDRSYQIQLKYRDTKDKRKHYFVQVINFRNFWYKKDSEGEFQTLFGEKCSKTYNYNERNFEGDINNDYRFMIEFLDKIYKPLEEKDVAIMFYDIETNQSIDIKNTDKEIISIAFYSSIFNKNYAYYLKKNKDITNDEKFLGKNIVVKCFNEEKEMLTDFLKVLKVHDLVFGFNSNFFDDIYFVNRCRLLKVPEIVGYFKDTFIKESVYEDRFMAMMMEKGSPVKSEINFIDAKPIVSKLFQRGNFVNKPSRYSLEEIGRILNVEQQKMHLTDGPSTLWEQDRIEELLEYNVQDVTALRAIMDKMKVIDMILTRKNLFKINFADIFKNSKVIDYLILSKYKHIVFPTVNYNTSFSEDFEGAVVLEPKFGIYKNVCVADFNSMYPNIIMCFNVSPETLVDKDKHIFRKDKPGLLGDILKFMLAQRYEYKKLAGEALKNNDSLSYDVYKMTEHQIKDTINSVYGVFAYKYFRLFDVNIASSITYFGRQLITSVAGYVAKEEPDFEVLGGDTDSLFIHYKRDTEDVVSVMEALEGRLNAFLKRRWEPEVINFSFKMEAETIFSFLILPNAKKTYIGLTKLLKGAKKDDEMYAKGFQLIRKDTPNGLKPSLQKFFYSFLHNVAKSDYVTIKKELKDIRLMWATLQPNDFLIAKQINKEVAEYKTVPQHVKAMLYSNKNLNTDFSRANYKGGLLFCHIKNSKYPKADCIMLDEETTLPREITVNYDKYFDLFLKNKIILLNPKFEDLIFSKNKTIWECIKQK
jgi:DNA polymerase elongation subunit (family B)